MESLRKSLRLVLPLLLALAAAALQIRAKQLGLPLLLAAAGGALLGYAAAFAVDSVAALTLRPTATPAPLDPRLQQLEQEKEMVLHSIKEIELDTALRKIAPEEAARLMEPLRQRALGLLRDLDRAQIAHPLPVEEQIEGEIARRIGPSPADGPGEAP